MRTIYRGSEISRGLKWSAGDKFEHSTLGEGVILEPRDGYAVVKVYDAADGKSRFSNVTYEHMRRISDGNAVDAPHVHQWEWDTSEVHTFDDEVADSIEGMFCACGKRLSVDQVRDIVNGVWKVGE